MFNHILKLGKNTDIKYVHNMHNKKLNACIMWCILRNVLHVSYCIKRQIFKQFHMYFNKPNLLENNKKF